MNELETSAKARKRKSLRLNVEMSQTAQSKHKNIENYIVKLYIYWKLVKLDSQICNKGNFIYVLFKLHETKDGKLERSSTQELPNFVVYLMF